MGVKAKEAQDAKIILGDPLRRLADKAHAAARDVVEPADIVEDSSIGGCRQCVDGEIAALGVGAPIAAELHPRFAAERLHILAQRRDFEGMRIDDHGDGAMLDPGRHRLPASCLDAAHDFVRCCRRRNVDLGDRHAQQFIAHRAADDAGFFAIFVEQSQQPGEPIVFEPGCVSKLHGRRHRVVPGTNLPFSMCAGT